MTHTDPVLSVLVGEHFACVKVSGRANFNISVDFKNIVTCLRNKGYNYVVVELSGCPLMDSTFLGVLAGFGLKASQSEGSDAVETVELRNANERIIELLDNLGVLYLFKTAQGTALPEGVQESLTPCVTAASKEDITRACLEAHQTLMDINPENVARFKDVTKFLAEDLEKLRAKK